MILQEFETLRALPAGVRKRIWDITERCESISGRTAVAFAAMAAKQCSAPYFEDLDRLLDQIAGTEPIRRALERLLRAKDLPLVRRLSKEYAEEDLSAFVLFCSIEECENAGEAYCRHDSIAMLSALFLDADETQSVADMTCGDGSFIVNAFPELGTRPVVAFETDRDKAAAAVLRCRVLGPNFRVLCRDVVTAPGDGRFDRVFVRPSEDDQKTRISFFSERSAVQSDDELPPSTTMTKLWLLVGAASGMLKPKGKAVIVVPTGVLSQRADSAIRRAYIRKGLIESVILLPDAVGQGAGTSYALLVLSEGNHKVRMIDARGVAARRGRELRIDAAGMERILNCIDAADSESCNVHEVILEEADWSLLPTRYLNERAIPDGRPLEEICTRIERGAQISVQKLEDLKSDVPTNCRYLRIADIEDGVVRADASDEYLIEMPDAAKKRCIRDGTLVLSRQGTPSYKSGVAHVREGEYVLAPGNVYMIDVDSEKADPYFLQAFLQSEAGVASLKKLGGASASNPIALADLRKLIVPVPPLESQRAVAELYRKTSVACSALRAELAQKCQQLSDVYDSSLE